MRPLLGQLAEAVQDRTLCFAISDPGVSLGDRSYIRNEANKAFSA